MPKWNINFTKIDNRANVVLNGIVIFDSGVIEGGPPANLDAPFILSPGVNSLVIQLFNTGGQPPATNPWQISYTMTDPTGNVVTQLTSGIPGIDNPLVNNTEPVFVVKYVLMS